MSAFEKFEGLVAAGFTPMGANGKVDVGPIPGIVEHLVNWEMAGIYVCGSTGEGVSLSAEERRAVAEAYVKAAAGRVPVIVQVGCDSMEVSTELAAHAQEIGADFLSASPPGYFPIRSIEMVVECMAEITSAAPGLPFYYYHIPRLSGVSADMVKFLELGAEAIPTLRGIKFSDLDQAMFLDCLHHEEGRFDILWGSDENLLGALATGARAAVGSTYNFAAPIYQEIMRCFAEGELERARESMYLVVRLIRALMAGEGAPMSAMKEVALPMLGIDIGVSRIPQVTLREETKALVKKELEAIGYPEAFTKKPEAVVHG